MRRITLGLTTLLLVACATQVPQQGIQSPLLSQSTRKVVPKPPVFDMPSPNHNERPEGMKIDTIVLHHTATAADAERVGKFFANPKSQVSSHYIVDRTGYIVQPVADHLRSWHAGRSEFQGRPNSNDYSIGIEICNLGDSVEPYPDSQYDGLIRLMAYLVQHYQIPLENITRHRDIGLPKGRKIDTSNNFSVPRVIEGVKAVLNGTYQPPALPPSQPTPAPTAQPDTPATRRVSVPEGIYTYEALADHYLDFPSRAAEVRYLNPGLRTLSPGQMVQIPTDYRFFALASQ